MNIQDRITSARFYPLPARAIVKAAEHGRKNWHWMLWWDGKLYDPFWINRTYCIVGFLTIEEGFMKTGKKKTGRPRTFNKHMVFTIKYTPFERNTNNKVRCEYPYTITWGRGKIDPTLGWYCGPPSHIARTIDEALEKAKAVFEADDADLAKRG